jgi:hypothetical protein
LIWFVLIIASVSTKSKGFFAQQPLGLQANPFTIGKYQIVLAVKTAKTGTPATKIKTKALPQLLYKYKRKFLHAGPRPDVPGYCYQLMGAVR